MVYLRPRAADRRAVNNRIKPSAPSTQFSSAAHDLRQPIQALKLLSNRLKRQPNISETVKEIASDIADTVLQMDTLVSALLDYARFAEGKIYPKMQDVVLSEVISEVMAVYQHGAEEHCLEIRTKIQGDIVVWADRCLLARAVGNIIGNAIKYTRKGKILVTARRRDSNVEISVWDTGPGISPPDQDLVFEEFYRTGDVVDGKGYGLGLTIVRHIISLMGGSITLTSRPWHSKLPEGKRIGCRFSMMFACGRSTPRPLQPESSPPRIVVVAGNAQLKRTLCDTFASWGCEVHGAGAMVQILQGMIGAAPPTHIVVDDRDAHGIRGKEVLDGLRIRWSPMIKGILIGAAEPEEGTAGDCRLALPLDDQALRRIIFGT